MLGWSPHKGMKSLRTACSTISTTSSYCLISLDSARLWPLAANQSTFLGPSFCNGHSTVCNWLLFCILFNTGKPWSLKCHHPLPLIRIMTLHNARRHIREPQHSEASCLFYDTFVVFHPTFSQQQHPFQLFGCGFTATAAKGQLCTRHRCRIHGPIGLEQQGRIWKTPGISNGVPCFHSSPAASSASNSITAKIWQQRSTATKPTSSHFLRVAKLQKSLSDCPDHRQCAASFVNCCHHCSASYKRWICYEFRIILCSL